MFGYICFGCVDTYSVIFQAAGRIGRRQPKAGVSLRRESSRRSVVSGEDGSMHPPIMRARTAPGRAAAVGGCNTAGGPSESVVSGEDGSTLPPIIRPGIAPGLVAAVGWCNTAGGPSESVVSGEDGSTGPPIMRPGTALGLGRRSWGRVVHISFGKAPDSRPPPA